MKCVICKESLNPFSMKVALAEGIEAHIECFYDDIPNPASKQDPDYEQQDAKRKQLIEQKAKELIEQSS